MALPTELVDSLNQTYFLHLLVNEKDKVVPPGKSVLSMLIHAKFRLRQEPSDRHADLVERVKEAAHKAFWREATEVLSSPMPSVQLPRLKQLYLDLHEALEPLFPPDHRISATLTAPPPPTSSPLLSTVNLLKEILVALRERCAPVRDQQIDAFLSTISFPPAAVRHPTILPSDKSFPLQASELQLSPLAQFVIDNIRAILSLADEMKSDLNDFALGSMTEERLMNVLSPEVESRERDFVLNLWDGKEELRDLWLSWLKETSRLGDKPANHRWVDRLFKALEADKPVFCVPPNHMSAGQNGVTRPVPNNLPPQLFFVIPALVYIQNYLQAVVIAAALQILAYPPNSTMKSPIVPSFSDDADLKQDFVERIWILLKAEIDADSIENPLFDGRPTTTSNNIPETKLVNLADEVVHARRTLAGGSLNADIEKRLRDGVDRTLRTSDPVFLLLRKRLFDALEAKLLNAIETIQHDAPSTKPAIPERMQTGRPTTGSQKKVVGIFATTWGSSPSNLHLKALLGGEQGAKTGVRFEVLGFEHDVLKNAVAEAYERLAQCIVWTETVWGNELRMEQSGGY